MKRTVYSSVFFILLISFSISGCFNNQPVESDILRYSNLNDIISPPDEFQLVYSLKTYNNYLALLEFDIDGVWQIERLSAPGFYTVWVERSIGDSNPQLDVITAQDEIFFVGFSGGIQYNIWANRSYGDETNNKLLLQFTKLDIDFENFTPRI